jgi:protocatechuate 3,4-dioxygenase beta subunit
VSKRTALWSVAVLVVLGALALVALLGGDDAPEHRPTTERATTHRATTAGLTSDRAATVGENPALPEPSVTAPPVRMTAASDPDPIGDGTATLTGRVMRDGTPLTSYGLIVTRNINTGMWSTPHSVRAKDGRFTLERVRAGTWNVFVGAPDIARKQVMAVKLVADQVTDLGDIDVDGGLRITGRVTDGTRPIAGATVKIAMSGMSGFTIKDAATGEMLSKPTPESESLAGRKSVTTDANGRYTIDGVLPDIGSRRMWIEASHPKQGAAVRTQLPDDDATIDFVLGATGALDGRISVEASQQVNARARRIDGLERGTSGRTDAEGRFHFEGLQPGDYEVLVMGPPGLPIWQPVRIKVVANQRASVTFASPANGITVEIVATRCSAMTLRPRDSTQFIDILAHIHRCDDGRAVLEQVEPGPYSLCRMKDCIPIDVAKTPARQRIDGQSL